MSVSSINPASPIAMPKERRCLCSLIKIRHRVSDATRALPNRAEERLDIRSQCGALLVLLLRLMWENPRGDLARPFGRNYLLAGRVDQFISAVMPSRSGDCLNALDDRLGLVVRLRQEAF